MTRRFVRVLPVGGMVAVAGLAFGQPAGTTTRQHAPATSYSQIEAAVVKADSLIKSDPRPFFKRDCTSFLSIACWSRSPNGTTPRRRPGALS